MKNTLAVGVQNCTPHDFELIKKYISDFELDDRKLQREEFITANNGSGMIGFGRVREFEHCSEICSLGVLTNERKKGIGKLLSRALIEKAEKAIYLVCIIPQYFEPLGFEICKDFPVEMQNKLDYCLDALSVEEEYVVMKKV